jgi:S1-C subfamily serine protease
MNKYDPFSSEENPFEQNRDPLLEEEEVYDVSKFQKKYIKIGLISIVFVLNAFFIINTFFNKDSNLTASSEKVDTTTLPTISIPEAASPDTTTIVSTTTTTTLPVSTQQETLTVYNNEEVAQPNKADQTSIIKKTIQVIAEDCGLGPDDREAWTNLGSGVLVSSNGYIISNSHILDDCYGEIYIATTDNPDTTTEIKYLAEIIEQSKDLDLVLLKIVSSFDNLPVEDNFEYFQLYESTQLQLGEAISIWGYPTARGDGISYNLKINLTKGTISGFESDFNQQRGWIITDADITYGNSGGAALDNNGRLIGIPTQGVTEGVSWIGYLRSVDVIKEWLSQTNNDNLLTNFSFPQLLIREHNFNDIPQYNRQDWNSWIDDDLDCQNTRHENLQLESYVNVLFTKSDNCYVKSGKWFDPYNGKYFYFASDLDIDHFIPLYNAHISGGWKWDSNKKTEFANSLEDPDILIAVKNTTNREKSAYAPDEWKPPNISYWCEYAYDWIRIKYEWNLSATLSEWTSLLEMISTCPTDFSYEDAKNKEHNMDIEKVLKYEK